MRDPKSHQYKSRRKLCEALKVPESTVRLQLRKFKHQIPIRTKALGMTGQRLLTDAEEDILVNVILDAQERGVCITKSNIIHMVSDFLHFQRHIEDGNLVEDDTTLAARLKSYDAFNDHTLKKHHKWYLGFRRRHPLILPKKPQYLGRKRDIVLLPGYINLLYLVPD